MDLLRRGRDDSRDVAKISGEPVQGYLQHCCARFCVGTRCLQRSLQPPHTITRDVDGERRANAEGIRITSVPERDGSHQFVTPSDGLRASVTTRDPAITKSDNPPEGCGCRWSCEPHGKPHSLNWHWVAVHIVEAHAARVERGRAAGP